MGWISRKIAGYGFNTVFFCLRKYFQGQGVFTTQTKGDGVAEVIKLYTVNKATLQTIQGANSDALTPCYLEELTHQLQEDTNEAFATALKEDKPQIVLNPLFFDKFGHFTLSIIKKRLALFDFNISSYAGVVCNIYQTEFDSIFHKNKTISQSQEAFTEVYKDYKMEVDRYKKEKKN